jgi:Tol biopolymer transport system component/DNA-binding winged helix-turn-helix (wHTH) protein
MAVHRDGVAIPLEPKAMDVLLYLLAHRDRLVTKDELMDAVWTDTFVTPNVLTRAIAQLRKGLGDDASEPRMIGTVSKRGYRFIAAVVETPGPGQAVERPKVATPEPASPLPTETALRWALPGALLLLVIAAVVVAAWWLRDERDTPVVAEIAATRFTTRQGYDSFPALSPDGRSAVYVSDRTGSLELYITGMTMGAPDVALTTNGGRNTQPEWSPDGRWIAFRSERHGGIWVVPAAGGAPQQISDFGFDPSWSSDSERLVFVSDGLSSATPSTLWTVGRDGAGSAPLTLSAPSAGRITMPEWSHNGRFLVFGLNTGSAFQEVWVAASNGQSARKVAGGVTGRDIRWMARDDGIVWGGVTDAGLSRLIRLRMNPETGESLGTPQALLPIDGGELEGLSLAEDGQAIFGIARQDANLWQIPVRGDEVGEASRLTNDTVRTTYPRIARDGRIAFVQFIEGRATTAWIMQPDGGGRQPILPTGQIQGAQWSQDDQRLFGFLDGKAVWIDAQTRRTTPIVIDPQNRSGVHMTSDDTGLLNHRTGADGIMNVWLDPFDGGAPRQLTFDTEGASYGVQSPDGQWLAVQLTRGADTWVGVAAARPGAALVPLVQDRGQAWVYSWSPDSRRIVFAGQRGDVWNVFAVDRTSGIVRQLTRWTNTEGYVRYPAWAPRGDRIVFERTTWTSSLWTAAIR